MKYKFKHSNIDKKYYCENLMAEASIIQREIEKLTVKREMLQDFARRIDTDLMEDTQDTLITKLWMDVCEATPVNGLLCDIRYQDSTTGYGRYEEGMGFVDCTPDISDVITHWKPAPRMEKLT